MRVVDIHALTRLLFIVTYNFEELRLIFKHLIILNSNNLRFSSLVYFWQFVGMLYFDWVIMIQGKVLFSYNIFLYRFYSEQFETWSFCHSISFKFLLRNLSQIHWSQFIVQFIQNVLVIIRFGFFLCFFTILWISINNFDYIVVFRIVGLS